MTIRIICLKAVLRRELVEHSDGSQSIAEDVQVYRFKSEASIGEAYQTVALNHPNAIAIEVYEPKSCALTMERL